MSAGIPLFIHLSNKYLLSIHYGEGTTMGIRVTVFSQITKNGPLHTQTHVYTHMYNHEML